MQIASVRYWKSLRVTHLRAVGRVGTLQSRSAGAPFQRRSILRRRAGRRLAKASAQLSAAHLRDGGRHRRNAGDVSEEVPVRADSLLAPEVARRRVNSVRPTACMRAPASWVIGPSRRERRRAQ